MVADEEPDGAIEKSCPVPLSETVWVLGTELSVTVRLPERMPVVVGSKKTPIEQDDPGETEVPQALKVPKSLPLVVTLEIVSDAVPLLVRVTVCGRPDVPTY